MFHRAILYLKLETSTGNMSNRPSQSQEHDVSAGMMSIGPTRRETPALSMTRLDRSPLVFVQFWSHFGDTRWATA